MYYHRTYIQFGPTTSPTLVNKQFLISKNFAYLKKNTPNSNENGIVRGIKFVLYKLHTDRITNLSLFIIYRFKSI